MHNFPKARRLRILTNSGSVSAITFLLAGCANLPSSGPTGSQIINSASSQASQGDFRLIELDSFAALPEKPAITPLPLNRGVTPPTDLIGPGDLLQINIYEVGVALFTGPGRFGDTAAADTTTQSEQLPPIRVDDQGYIRIPYAGRLRAAGQTTTDLEKSIRGALAGMSQNPQIMVTIRDAINNSVIMGGEISRPGRLVLPTNNVTIADAIALAGGYRGEAKDLLLRIQRRAESLDLRVSDVLSGAENDRQVLPGDRITILRAPLTFSVMGAPSKVEQIPFSSASISLAEAVALAGGANPNLGDPKAIFVFRFVRNEEGAEVPTVYHLNMMNAGAYFVSQRFAMADKDVLYFGNAKANQPSKLAQIISQIFSPITSAAYIASITAN